MSDRTPDEDEPALWADHPWGGREFFQWVVETDAAVAPRPDPDGFTPSNFPLIAGVALRTLRRGLTPSSILLIADLMARQGASKAEGIPWLTVLMASADTGPVQGLQVALTMNWSGWMAGWGVPSPLAALAWAAGVSPAEAQAQRAAGNLNEDSLRALAVLRGFRLPAVFPGADA